MRSSDDEITTLSAAQLCEGIRTRTLSPVEIMEAHLRRVEALNPVLNAIVTFAPDALERARAAERALMSGAELPPLHGLPLTIKDTIDTAGLRTTSGSRVRADRMPARDAPAVALLRAAGAIVLGKTNTSEMALDYNAENSLFGRTGNPHDLTRTPGGSSGGCAAAVGACLSPAGLGSDLAGSIRLPAHFCGITGLYPTPGTIPPGGQFLPAEGALGMGASLGPLARRVDDLALLFNVLARVDDKRVPNFANEYGAPVSATQLRGLRVACFADDGFAPVTAETENAVESAAHALAAAGLETFEARPPGIERATELWLALFSRAVRMILRAEYVGREDVAGASVRALIERPEDDSDVALEKYFDAWAQRDHLRAVLLEWMRETPLLLAPVGAVPAFAHGARKVAVRDEQVSLFRAFGYAQACNVFGLPAVSVPAGRTREGGLPIGVQIIGRPFQEPLVLAAARIIEDALGGWQPPAIILPSGGVDPL